MKINRSSPAVKAASILMTLILTAGMVTSCAEKTSGRRIYNNDSAKTDADDTIDAPVPDTSFPDTTDPETVTGSEPVTENTYDGDRRYATDYPIDVKESKSGFLDDWIIWKRQEDGVTFLQIFNSGSHGRETEIEYLSFWVYDSEEEAKKAYDGYYNKSKRFDNGTFWEEGDTWFISNQPDVMDASYVWMNYREDNVIIYAQLGTPSSWSKAKEGDESSGSDKFDPATLKDYILENPSDIRSYVIDVIMEA